MSNRASNNHSRNRRIPAQATKAFAKSNQQNHLNNLSETYAHHYPFLSLRLRAGRQAGWEGIAKGKWVAYEAALDGALEAALEGKKKFGKRTIRTIQHAKPVGSRKKVHMNHRRRRALRRTST